MPLECYVIFHCLLLALLITLLSRVLFAPFLGSAPRHRLCLAGVHIFLFLSLFPFSTCSRCTSLPLVTLPHETTSSSSEDQRSERAAKRRPGSKRVVTIGFILLLLIPLLLSPQFHRGVFSILQYL